VAVQYAGALYLVPVIAAAVIAFLVTRPGRNASADDDQPIKARATVAPVVPMPRRASSAAASGSTGGSGAPAIERRKGSRRPMPKAGPQPMPPTLFHAALSSHLTAVSRTAPGPVKAANSASLAAGLAAHQNARLVSARRPTRIPRRPSHQCPYKKES
jgi:hypothetical protein